MQMAASEIDARMAVLAAEVNATAPAKALRPFTVAVSYPGYYGATVTVHAANVAAACELAIEEANNDSGAWKSLDACGETCVDAIAEGDDVDPWARNGSTLPVPAKYREPERVKDEGEGVAGADMWQTPIQKAFFAWHQAHGTHAPIDPETFRLSMREFVLELGDWLEAAQMPLPDFLV